MGYAWFVFYRLLRLRAYRKRIQAMLDSRVLRKTGDLGAEISNVTAKHFRLAERKDANAFSSRD